MEDRWKRIYHHHAEIYERLVRCEDYQGNLLPALNQIRPLNNADVVEFGAGTGRITFQLAPMVRSVRAFDVAPAMVKLAFRKLKRAGMANCEFSIGDSRAMPLPSASADVALEGWSFLQIVMWHLETWRKDVGKAIDEAVRIVRPGGTVILIETLGTGVAVPDPPQVFTVMYDYLERERGFKSTWIRTDYWFTSRTEALEVVNPFFDDIVPDALIELEEGVVLPECTGIWWREF